MSHDEMLKMIQAMHRYGVSFVRALSECFIIADENNLLRLETAFPEIVSQYCAMANKDLEYRNDHS